MIISSEKNRQLSQEIRVAQFGSCNFPTCLIHSQTGQSFAGSLEENFETIQSSDVVVAPLGILRRLAVDGVSAGLESVARLTLLSDAVFRWPLQFPQFSRSPTVAGEHPGVEAFQRVYDDVASRCVFVELKEARIRCLKN